MNNIIKYFLIFVGGCFIGSLIETIWCFIVSGKFIKRRDLIYGYFTSMYGSAAVLIVLVLEFFKVGDIKCIFLIALIISGVVEYMTSFMLEKWFNIRFWDYSKIKPNLQGRVNLWYLIMFGIVGVGWWEVYSFLCNIIDFRYGILFIIIIFVLFIFFIINFIITCYLFYRYKKRREGVLPQSNFEKWLDLKYDNKKIKRIFPALEVVNEIKIK